MDSVSQAALGAVVGVAVLGKERPFWQAALAGAVIGTLPDLDVYLDKGDAINNMVLHRAETHAFFWQLVASGPIAYLFSKATNSGQLLKRWWVMTVLVLFTHSILDGLTIYGTRLALPFSDAPYGSGSLFIIDPLYTLPLLIGLLVAAFMRSEKRYSWNLGGLAISTAYAVWAVSAQLYVTSLVMASPEADGIKKEQVLVTPTPFNTMLWRIVLVDGDSYREGFYSLLDPMTKPDSTIRYDRYERGLALDLKTQDFEKANQIRSFTKGLYSLTQDGDYLRITDLRMGQHPFFVFSFRFAKYASPLQAIEPVRITNRMPLKPGLIWLRDRMFLGDNATGQTN